MAVETDHVICATGYRADLRRLTFIDPALRAKVKTVNDAPGLNFGFESSERGLYFAGIAAAMTFGPLMRFMYGDDFAASTSPIASPRAVVTCVELRGGGGRDAVRVDGRRWFRRASWHRSPTEVRGVGSSRSCRSPRTLTRAAAIGGSPGTLPRSSAGTRRTGPTGCSATPSAGWWPSRPPNCCAPVATTSTFVGLIDAIYDRRYWPFELFARATLRRTAGHLRRLSRRPPDEAWSELRERSPAARAAVIERASTGRPRAIRQPRARGDGRMAARRRSTVRCSSAAVAPTIGAASQLALGAVAPRPPGASHTGSHADLVRVPAVTAALARAVDDAVDSADAPPLRVLLAATFGWEASGRLAVELAAGRMRRLRGRARTSALHDLSVVTRSYRLDLVRPLRSLRHAIVDAAPDLVIPFDDRTRQALHQVYEHADPATPEGTGLRTCCSARSARPRSTRGSTRAPPSWWVASGATCAAPDGGRRPSTTGRRMGETGGGGAQDRRELGWPRGGRRHDPAEASAPGSG